jgi:FAD/FMN-containing dehydrogenase
MKRRRVLQGVVGVPLLARVGPGRGEAAERSRVRPDDPGWPSATDWEELGRAVGGRLIAVRSPLEACKTAPEGCPAVLEAVRNPYWLRDQPGLTQALGWVDAWTSRPSAYAVAAESAADVAAAVRFAARHRLRLVVKGGGHAYQGGSSAPDSLLVWTRPMDRVEVHGAFVAAGCGTAEAAVSVGAGVIWGAVYDAVTTRAGRYVQGGGCLTVGVAGLVLGGGFGSFSKAYGLAAASLIEAEVVTADGAVRVVNACSEPALFWALKGGGGSFGVVTRLTLRTHELPETFGAVNLSVQAASDAAFRRLVERMVGFYAEALFDPAWGEQIAVGPENALDVAMVFQGLSQEQATAVWRPFLDWVAGEPELGLAESVVLAAPARSLWDPAFLKRVPGLVASDARPGAPAGNIYWASNAGEAGQVIHGYRSAWVPAALLAPERQGALAAALFAASRHWRVSLHLNKGLAGAPEPALAAARDTGMNPAALDAFALAISGAEGPPGYPGVPGHEPDVAQARREAAAVGRAMDELARVGARGAYVSESDFFEPAWRDAFWGPNYARLLAAKDRYDPGGLFFVHHGVGSERWSPDGFTPLE